MRVVLEGPDGAGKTTLAGKIADRYGVDATQRTHNGPPEEHAPAALTVKYLADVARPVAVVDRWALGETIYGPRLRGVSLIQPLYWRALAQALDATCTPLVLCLPPKAVAKANWEARHAEEFVKNSVTWEQVYDAYASWRALPGAFAHPRYLWVHDYTAENWDALWGFLDVMEHKQTEGQ